MPKRKSSRTRSKSAKKKEVRKTSKRKTVKKSVGGVKFSSGICPECGYHRFFEDPVRGEKVCARCGLVLEESMVDFSQEWRAFDEEQKARRARTGAPLTSTKHDKGLTTEIGKSGEIFKVAPEKRAQYHRLAKWQKRLIESKDRNLSFALSELQRLVSYLGLSKTIHEEVARRYEEAVDKGLVRGRSMESVIAALLYAVCREMGTPRTLEEIEKASGVDKREIGRTYRYIARQLNIKILPAQPEDYVPRFTTMLGLSDRVQAKAVQILKKAKENYVTSGKGPKGVAAAAVYIAAVLQGEKKTQREIAEAVGVTEVTIRNRFKELVEKLGIAEEIEKKIKELEENL